eukprot:scaffold7336_cov88-Cylindrotheca_fusiformis.AAC.1
MGSKGETIVRQYLAEYNGEERRPHATDCVRLLPGSIIQLGQLDQDHKIQAAHCTQHHSQSFNDCIVMVLMKPSHESIATKGDILENISKHYFDRFVPITCHIPSRGTFPDAQVLQLNDLLTCRQAVRIHPRLLPTSSCSA